MKIKNLYISAGILLTISVIILLTGNSSSTSDNDPRINTKLLSQDSLKSLSTIRLKSGSDTVTIKQDESTRKWLLKEKYNLPITFSKLSNFINDLTSREIKRVATTRSDRLNDLGITGSNTIQLTANDDSIIETIEIGKLADNDRQIVKISDESKAYLIDQSIDLDTNALSWLDKQLLDIEVDSVTELTLQTTNGEVLSVNRADSKSDWAENNLVSTRSIKQEAITSILNQFKSIRFSDLADLDDDQVIAARQNGFDFTLKTGDGETFKVSIGRRPEKVIASTDSDNNENTEEVNETQTEPAGPVYILATSSTETDSINEYMKAAAFEVSDYLFNNLVKPIDTLTEIEETDTGEVSDTGLPAQPTE